MPRNAIPKVSMNYKEKAEYLPILAQYELPANAVPILLVTYKYGIAQIPTEINIIKKLGALGWAKINIIPKGKSICMLTDEGAEWVENHLFELLSLPLTLSFPALITKDEIQLATDVKKENYKYQLTSPAMSMDRGRYFLAQINRGHITLVDDCQVPYKLNLDNADDILALRQDSLGTLQEELEKRFHEIKIKSLTKRLYESVPSLTLTEWVEELYYRRHTKWRIGV